LLHRSEWRRIYAAFSACAEARIHTRCLSDRGIIHNGVPNDVRLILAPVLEFVSPELRAALERFIGIGGALLVTDQECWDSHGNPSPSIDGAQKLKGELYDVFPLDGSASLDVLAQSADITRAEVERREIDRLSWVFDLSYSHLPPARETELRTGDQGVKFEHWLYEHGSDWILPYLASQVE
jgi:hypothetical protein